MGQRADALAMDLERTNAGVIAFTESLFDADWDVFVPNEERRVGVVIQHIAFAYTAEINLIRAILIDDRLPGIYESCAQLDKINARHAMQLQAGTRDDALQELRRQGDDAASFIRALDDADLEKSRALGLWDGEVFTVGSLIERIILGHPQGHLASIRAALGRESPASSA